MLCHCKVKPFQINIVFLILNSCLFASRAGEVKIKVYIFLYKVFKSVFTQQMQSDVVSLQSEAIAN